MLQGARRLRPKPVRHTAADSHADRCARVHVRCERKEAVSHLLRTSPYQVKETTYPTHLHLPWRARHPLVCQGVRIPIGDTLSNGIGQSQLFCKKIRFEKIRKNLRAAGATKIFSSAQCDPLVFLGKIELRGVLSFHSAIPMHKET